MNSKLRTVRLLVLAPLILAALVACAPIVPLTPASDATNPGCAEIIVRLPGTVAGLAIRQTNAQATGAWGNPTAVLLRCGVTPPGPTTTTCYTVNGVDWLIDDSKKPRYVFTTYGRTPATQVVIDSKLTDGQGTIVLDQLANAIGSIRQTRKCVNTEDVLGTGSSNPTATPSSAPSP